MSTNAQLISRESPCKVHVLRFLLHVLHIPFIHTVFVYRDYMAKYTYHHHHPVLALKEDLQSGGRQAYRNRKLLANLYFNIFVIEKVFS
jgi:hypothetical protein